MQPLDACRTCKHDNYMTTALWDTLVTLAFQYPKLSSSKKNIHQCSHLQWLERLEGSSKEHC